MPNRESVCQPEHVSEHDGRVLELGRRRLLATVALDCETRTGCVKQTAERRDRRLFRPVLVRGDRRLRGPDPLSEFGLAEPCTFAGFTQRDPGFHEAQYIQ